MRKVLRGYWLAHFRLVSDMATKLPWHFGRDRKNAMMQAAWIRDQTSVVQTADSEKCLGVHGGAILVSL